MTRRASNNLLQIFPPDVRAFTSSQGRQAGRAEEAGEGEGGMKISLFRFVRHEQAADYLRCGWLARPALNGTHHGEWSALVEWVCDCDPVFPEARQ